MFIYLLLLVIAIPINEKTKQIGTVSTFTGDNDHN